MRVGTLHAGGWSDLQDEVDEFVGKDTAALGVTSATFCATFSYSCQVV